MICRKVVKNSSTEVLRRPAGCNEIAPYTDVKTVGEVKVEESKDYIVVTADDVYVYPKSVWERIQFYVDYFRKSGVFPNPGLLFTGPPGTGKTTLSRIITDMLGLDRVFFSFAEVLGPYVGQSEKGFQAKIDEALRSRPSALIIDEADTLLMSREIVVQRIGVSSADLNIKSMLLDTMSRFKESEVLFIAITNISPSLIDSALKREGRFGEPVYVPVPTKDAVEILIERKFPQFLERREELASKLASSMQNFANIVSYLKRLGYGIDRLPEEPLRGYKIIYVKKPYTDRRLERFFSSLDYPELYFVKANPDLGIPVLAAYFVSVGKGNVVVYNAKGLDEAIKVAETYNAVLIVDERSGIPIKELFRVANIPIVVVGENVTGKEIFHVDEYNEDMINIIFSAYNIRATPRRYTLSDLERIIYHCKGGDENCIKKLRE